MESTVAVVLLILVWVSVFCDGTVIVSKDGSGDYRTVGEAITEAPDLSEKPYTIHVRADIRGEGFMAENMGFANWAGLNASGAVAVRNEGKKTIFFRCSIEGLQDTLWAVSGGQFYKDSDIYGTVDFIYGNAAAVFQDCTLYARYRPYVTFTAQSREDPNDNTGFTFQRCNFTISPQDSDRKSEVRATLGRPLRPYSRVAIFHSYIDSFVDPKGWEPMPHQPTDKATYIEFLNLGPGSHTDGRVQWPGVTRLLHPAQALPFTASYLLDADSWIPSTGVPYDNTL
ncbi:probable pectinesterase/pectinesterase inhibitor 46 isoform X2 [Cajanus cajan]|uniref:probable pectinesterase/pectinesterase inhibitor 46 isoform X2 n=1 Tax=Cajanus cajan TaxID=3821 RepID=UPI0010FB1BDE|nr:probable pectinesterase/pectinesterase inhibitor 46 isoform X2 [Cajanus cajan]